jgi:hypothetical protein
MTAIYSDTFLLTQYDTQAQATIALMEKSLAARSLSLTYNSLSTRFVILGSSSYSKEQIEKIFGENHYQVWCPHLNDIDKETGNHLVEILSDAPVELEEPQHTGAITLPGFPLQSETLTKLKNAFRDCRKRCC